MRERGFLEYINYHFLILRTVSTWYHCHSNQSYHVVLARHNHNAELSQYIQNNKVSYIYCTIHSTLCMTWHMSKTVARIGKEAQVMVTCQVRFWTRAKPGRIAMFISALPLTNTTRFYLLMAIITLALFYPAVHAAWPLKLIGFSDNRRTVIPFTIISIQSH